MTKNIFKVSAVSAILTLGITMNSQAGLLVEPSLNYETGTTKCTMIDGTDCGSTTTGTALGARVGYKMILPLWVALDINMGSGKLKDAASSYDYTRTTYGVDVGFDLPILLRAWAGYVLTDDTKVKFAAGGEKTYKGTSTKVGVGFTGFPFVSINLNYYIDSLKELETGGVTYSKSSQYTTFDSSRVMLGVSIPFNL